MSSKIKNKNKKPLRTTLGTAPSKNNNTKGADVSHLQKPIETSLFGLKQALSLFETATEEVRDYISYECDLIYECRVCRTLFRSLANFILHKREYCKEKFMPIGNCYYNNESHKSKPEEESNRVIFKPFTRSEKTKRSLSTVLQKLEARQKSEEISREVLNENLSKVERFSDESEELKAGDIALEEINDTLSGVFQTVINKSNKLKDNELLKTEVMEIHSMLNNDEVILGPDGKIIHRSPKPAEKLNVPEFNLTCHTCKQKFSTRKTLTHHLRYMHNNSKIVYLCPESTCKNVYFSNSWSVFRHLFKVHRKSALQVKRLRSLIQGSAVKLGQLPQNKQAAKEVEKNEQNQWMEDIEGDNDLQMCGGCGKRFERKAALHSHSQLCVKRIAACNLIKEKVTNETEQKKIPVIVKPLTTVRSNNNNNNNSTGSNRRKSTVLKKQFRKVSNNQWDIVNKEETTSDDISEIKISKPEDMIIEIDDNEKKNDTSNSSDVICVSDDEEETVEIDLVSKASSYMSINELKCTSCKCSFKNREKLMKHMSYHFTWFHFQCNICFYKSYDEKTGLSHVKKSHPSNEYNEKVIVPLLPNETIQYSTEFREIPLLTTDVDSDDAPDSDVECRQPESQLSNMQDPSLQKMIMEVIFGNVSETNTRPIRNRVKPKNDDFVYEGEMKYLNQVSSSAPANGKTLKLCKKKRLGEESKDV